MREWSLDKMHTQYEWLYKNMSVVSRHDNFIFNQTIIVYTVSISGSRNTEKKTFTLALSTVATQSQLKP